MNKNNISPFAAAVLKMNPRELENGDWKIVHEALLEAKRKLKECSLGNQSWLDGAIGISQERALTKSQNAEHSERIDAEILRTNA